jgi:hypothetical protein
MLSLPLRGLGLLLGVTGGMVALADKGRAIGFPIAGSLLSAVALAIGIFWYTLAKGTTEAIIGPSGSRVADQDRAHATNQAGKARAKKLAALAESEAKAMQEAEAQKRAEREQEQTKQEGERIARREKEERRVKDLYERHGSNFFSVEGKSYRKDGLRLWEAPRYRVIQVVDDGNMLIEVRRPVGERYFHDTMPGWQWGNGDSVGEWRQDTVLETWWLTGVNTSGAADGQTYGNVEFAEIGTKRYTTAFGSSRTVVLAVMRASTNDKVSLEEFRKILSSGESLGKDWVAEQKAIEKQQEANTKKRLDQQAAWEKERDQAIKREYLRKEEQRRKEYEAAGIPTDGSPEEVEATRKLKLAMILINDGIEKERKNREPTDESRRLLEYGCRRLREIIAAYPMTKAAERCKKLLEEHQSQP